jgi:non-ribosomal peptide synthetase component F
VHAEASRLFQIEEDVDFAGVPIRKHDFWSPRIEDFMISIRAGCSTTDLRISFDANEQCYDEAALNTHGRCFLQLIDELARAADSAPVPHYRLGMLSVEEREQVLFKLNPSRPLTAARILPALFEARVASAPDAVAIVRGQERLSYGALNRRANRVAHRLIREGVGPESLVGLSAERSPASVVGLLAILKAGAAYLPLDPACPTARLAVMLGDARPSLILTEAGSFLPLGPPRLVIDETEAEESCDRNPTDTDRRAQLALDHPACVIHTSGSSGTAKSVVVTHRGIAALAEDQTDRLGLSPRARVAQLASMFSIKCGVAPMALGHLEK